jgi:hypothetical protein
MVLWQGFLNLAPCRNNLNYRCESMLQNLMLQTLEEKTNATWNDRFGPHGFFHGAAASQSWS